MSPLVDTGVPKRTCAVSHQAILFEDSLRSPVVCVQKLTCARRSTPAPIGFVAAQPLHEAQERGSHKRALFPAHVAVRRGTTAT